MKSSSFYKINEKNIINYTEENILCSLKEEENENGNHIGLSLSPSSSDGQIHIEELNDEKNKQINHLNNEVNDLSTYSSSSSSSSSDVLRTNDHLSSGIILPHAPFHRSVSELSCADMQTSTSFYLPKSVSSTTKKIKQISKNKNKKIADVSPSTFQRVSTMSTLPYNHSFDSLRHMNSMNTGRRKSINTKKKRMIGIRRINDEKTNSINNKNRFNINGFSVNHRGGLITDRKTKNKLFSEESKWHLEALRLSQRVMNLELENFRLRQQLRESSSETKHNIKPIKQERRYSDRSSNIKINLLKLNGLDTCKNFTSRRATVGDECMHPHSNDNINNNLKNEMNDNTKSLLYTENFNKGSQHVNTSSSILSSSLATTYLTEKSVNSDQIVENETFIENTDHNKTTASDEIIHNPPSKGIVLLDKKMIDKTSENLLLDEKNKYRLSVQSDKSLPILATLGSNISYQGPTSPQSLQSEIENSNSSPEPSEDNLGIKNNNNTMQPNLFIRSSSTSSAYIPSKILKRNSFNISKNNNNLIDHFDPNVINNYEYSSIDPNISKNQSIHSETKSSGFVENNTQQMSYSSVSGSNLDKNIPVSPMIDSFKTSEDIKIWVGTWNMGATDPFSDSDGIIDEQNSAAMIQHFVPHGYHLYSIGIQEGLTDNVYHAIVAYLNRNPDGIRYYRLHLQNSKFLIPQKTHTAESTIDSVRGRGDGALMGKKFTGIALFYSSEIENNIILLRAATHKFNITSGSKGGVAAAIKINKSTLVFLNCHLDAKDAKNSTTRREQIKVLNMSLGRQLGGYPDFDLTEQFHHIIWMGDLNYRIHTLDAETVLHMLSNNRNDELHQKFDGLIADKQYGTFHGFIEPMKFPDFYPTYKKYPQRGYIDTIGSNTNWPLKVYRILYKEPFYKGGQVKTRVPGWCDRILVHTIPDCLTELKPEKIPHPYKKQIWIDNYKSINDGVGMDISDHSPVCCTFILKYIGLNKSPLKYHKLSKLISFQKTTVNPNLNPNPNLNMNININNNVNTNINNNNNINGVSNAIVGDKLSKLRYVKSPINDTIAEEVDGDEEYSNDINMNYNTIDYKLTQDMDDDQNSLAGSIASNLSSALPITPMTPSTINISNRISNDITISTVLTVLNIKLVWEKPGTIGNAVHSNINNNSSDNHIHSINNNNINNTTYNNNTIENDENNNNNSNNSNNKINKLRNTSHVVPKKVRMIAPLLGEDIKQYDASGERMISSKTNGFTVLLNVVITHIRPLEDLHILLHVKHDSSLSGHVVVSLNKLSKALKKNENEVRYRIPLRNNSSDVFIEGYPVKVHFSLRAKVF